MTEEWMQEWIDRGSPWCDTCKRPAVFSETHGMVHATPEFQFGLPQHLDESGHDVTMQEWWHR